MNPELHTKDIIQIRVDDLEQRLLDEGFDEDYKQVIQKEIERLSEWL